MNTNLISTYTTDGSSNVISLTVTVGYAQIGSTAVALSGDQLILDTADENGNYDGTFTINIGTNAALKGKLLGTVTGISRVQPGEDATVIIQLTSNGVTKTYDTIGGPLTSQGGRVTCVGAITFN